VVEVGGAARREDRGVALRGYCDGGGPCVAMILLKGAQIVVIEFWCLGTRGCVLNGERKGNIEIVGQGVVRESWDRRR
jgi:hypothetical protein